MSNKDHKIQCLNNEECHNVNGGSLDGFGPGLPPQKSGNDINPAILNQLRRIRLYGAV